MQVNKLVLGCEVLGWNDWGNYDKNEAIRTVHEAYDRGIKSFDTADIYGLGISEIELGKILKSFNYDYCITTKGGVKWSKSNDAHRAKTTFDNNPEYISNCIENSLKRLDVDHIDRYLIHWPANNLKLDLLINTLLAHQKKGNIKSFGFCNVDEKLLDEITLNFNIDITQNSFSLIDQSKKKILKKSIQSKILSMGYGTLAQGLLTNKDFSDVNFDNTDRRHRLPHFQEQFTFLRDTRISKLQSLSRSLSIPLSAIAIDWAIKSGLVDEVIVGAKTIKQLDENLNSGNAIISSTYMSAISEIFKK